VKASLKRVDAITLFVEDLEHSKSFYRDIFRMPVVYEDDVSAIYGFENTMINLIQISEAAGLIEPRAVASREAGARFMFSVFVDDVDAVCRELDEHGVELVNGPIDRPWGKRTATFTDPAGNVWEIAQDIPGGDES
jgi:catechol 2,3-dioxygenase-like lactoylglutathione lyase family enzyme